MKKLAMALVPFLVVGCGAEDANGDGIADGIQDPNNVSVVVPATPKGTVSGQVLTTQQRPLVGASVAMTIGSATVALATTDESGSFTLQGRAGRRPGAADILQGGLCLAARHLDRPDHRGQRAASTTATRALARCS